MSIKKNDIIEILIESMTSEGNGLGKHGCFCPSKCFGR